jgi:SNF2 family DNA or RNA helicase
MRAKADLRAAQQRTITRLYEEPATQAVLGMGAGKTASALTAFAELKADGFAQDMFVLAPKRVSQLVWPAEPRLWEHLAKLKVVFVGGTAAQRAQALRTPADIYAIGIDNTQWFIDWALTQKPARLSRSVLCIDESSRFKNPRGKRGKALFSYLYRNLQAFMAIWELTGTPRPNGYEDQFMPLKLATRGRLWGKSFDRWREANFYPTDYMGYTWRVQPEKERGLIEAINTVSITIPLSEMPDVPELNDGPDFIEWVDMPRDVRATYDTMKKHLVAELQKKGGTVAAANMAVASGKLSQLVQGFLYAGDVYEFTPETRPRGANFNTSGYALIEGKREVERFHDVKMERLLELLETLDGEPALIAYEFQEDLDQLKQQFPAAPWLGKGTTDKQAVQNESDWNAGKLPVMFVHPASAGHGLNLQHGGAQLFWYGMTWSAELYDQLLKRLHRPGQHQPVFSRPILMRDTVDELKYERVRNKMSAQAAFQRLLKEV